MQAQNSNRRGRVPWGTIVRTLIALGVVGVLCGGTTVLVLCWPAPEDPCPLRLTRHVLRDRQPADRVEEAAQRVRITGRSSLSSLLHGMHVFGIRMPVPHPTDGKGTVPAVDVMLNHALGTKYFGGDPPLIPTRYGVRCRVTDDRDGDRQREREAHPGQLLAILAQEGVSLDAPLTTAAGRGKVRDILNDTLATFSLTQEEIEWVAIALSLYLPPQRSWKDKFGRETTFNDLARRLLRMRLDRPDAACHGIHLLEALATLYMADRQRPVLAASTRLVVRTRLEKEVATLMPSQQKSGAWPPLWHASAARRAEIMSTYLKDPKDRARQVATVTAHHLEWLLLLPSEMRPPDEVLAQAARCLRTQLLAATEEEIQDGYCPYSHAACMVRHLFGPTDPAHGVAPSAFPSKGPQRTLGWAGKTNTTRKDGAGRRQTDRSVLQSE